MRRDLTGQIFGRWTVKEIGKTVGIGRKSKGTWKCVCECGNEAEVYTSNLTGGLSRSCGCLQKDYMHWNRPALKHGKSGKPEWGMWHGARNRARERGIAFDLKVTDIVIPATCPLLGIPIVCGKDGMPLETSPSLDRIDNSKGYTLDNVWVISRKANTIKSTATYQELETIAKKLKERILNE